MAASLEQLQRWWDRLSYFTPPWGWRSDPYLTGITEEEVVWLRELEDPPTTTFEAVKSGRVHPQ